MKRKSAESSFSTWRERENSMSEPGSRDGSPAPSASTSATEHTPPAKEKSRKRPFSSATLASPLLAPSKHRTASFLVEGEVLYVNAHFLAERSPVFEKMFFGEFEEAKTQSVELKDENFTAIYELLLVMGVSPTEERRTIKAYNCAVMLRLADKFDVAFVRKECEEYLRSRVLQETPPAEQAFHMLVSAVKFGIEPALIANLVGLLGGYGLNKILEMDIHKKIPCPKVAAALFTCASAHVDGLKCYNAHYFIGGSDSPAEKPCQLLDCQKLGRVCMNCGLTLCDPHTAIRCPNKRNGRNGSEHPPPAKRRIHAEGDNTFKIVPYRLRHANVHPAFFTDE